jgi:hypothetical protein
MTTLDLRAAHVADALRRCPPLATRTPERDALWFTVRATVCTRGKALVTPLGSAAQVWVTEDHVTTELIAAMAWLVKHEAEARRLSPDSLFVQLRGEATKGANGSGRAAQADALHGMTNVPPGHPVRFDELDAAS